MPDQDIKNYINELISLGEDAEELNYWYNIFDYLPTEQQELLIENWKSETEALKKIKI